MGWGGDRFPRWAGDEANRCRDESETRRDEREQVWEGRVGESRGRDEWKGRVG